jgi:lactobin A/cerein 7B family class IIb bacteriocin
MRELTSFELEQVEGGNPVVVGVVIGAGVIALAGLAVVAYGISEGCSGSMEVNAEGIKVEVTCPAT